MRRSLFGFCVFALIVGSWLVWSSGHRVATVDDPVSSSAEGAAVGVQSSTSHSAQANDHEHADHHAPAAAGRYDHGDHRHESSLVSINLDQDSLQKLQDFEQSLQQWLAGEAERAAQRAKPMTPASDEQRERTRELLAHAKARAAVMRALMGGDAAQAFERAVPAHIRAQLPEAVQPFIEEHRTARGDFDRLCMVMPDGTYQDAFGVQFAGHGRAASVMPVWTDRISIPDIPLYALVLDDSAALSEHIGRTLPQEEVLARGLEPERHYAEIAGAVVAFDDESSLLAAIDAAQIVQPVVEQGGSQSLLIIRIDFSDMPGDPSSVSGLTDLVTNKIDPYYIENSYGIVDFQGTLIITDTLRMPQTAQYYKDLGSYYALLNDADEVAIAANSAWNRVNFDNSSTNNTNGTSTIGSRIVAFERSPVKIFSWAGLASMGGSNVWLSGYNTRENVVSHELGHNFGFHHANGWKVKNGSGIDDTSSASGYADPIDVMGNQSAGDLSSYRKFKANWIPASDTLAINGLELGSHHDLILKSHDSYNYDSGLRLISIVRDNLASSESWEYLLDYRRDLAGNSTFQSWDKGIIVNWRRLSSIETNVLDMNPGTVGNWKDGGLRIGTTLSDYDSTLFGDIHITPVEEVPGTIPGMRVVINLGTAGGNTAPSGTITQTFADVNQDITLTVTPSDPDGDTKFAYFWTFDDGSISLDGQPVQTRQWSTTGFRTVSCTISDMKGGVTTVTFDVYVGLDPDVPKAELAANPVTEAGGSTHTFTVTYSTGTNAVDVSTIDGNDLRVTGPGGYDVAASLVGVDIDSDGTPRVATYSISAPGGTWDAADTGTYAVVMQADQVASTTNKHAPAGSLGSFNAAAYGDTLLVHYKLDEAVGASVAVDSSGLGHDAAVGGGSFLPTGGQRAGAFEAAGNAAHQIIDQDANLYLNGLDAITVAAWIKSDDLNTDQGWLLGKAPDSTGGSLMFRYDASSWFAGQAGGSDVTNCIQLQLETTDGTVGVETPGNTQTTAWQHVAMTWQSGSLPTVYLDGVAVTPHFAGLHANDVVTAGQVSNGTVSGIEQLLIGRSVKDTNGSWDGKIDDVRIYSYVLSAGQVAALYSGSSRSISIGSTVTDVTWDSDPVSTSLDVDQDETHHFNGLQDGVDVLLTPALGQSN